MFGWLAALSKSFFSSIWTALRQFRLDREQKNMARTESENAELKEQARLLRVKEDRENSNNINDALNRFK